MGIGSYLVAVEDSDGRVVQTFERTTRTAIPRVGEQIEIDDELYLVRAVRHEQDDGRTVRVYTQPRVFVRLVEREALH